MQMHEKTAVILLSLLILAGGAALAQPASVALGEAGLILTPQVPYDSAIVAVSGEGRRVLRRVFGAGEPIALVPVDSQGYSLTDGTYRWELRLVIEAASARSGEAAAVPTVTRQSGAFSIRDGRMIEPPAGASMPAGPAAADGVSIANTAPGIVLEDTATGDDDYLIGVDGDVMSVFREGTEEILTIQNGVVGLFQSAPDNDVSLHISTGTALPSIRFEGSTGAWDLVQSSDDLQLKDSGELFPPTVLEVEKQGGAYSLEFDGDGNFTGIVTDGSSREIKRDVEPAAGAELLATLRSLPLYAWSYTKDSADVRHLGPMAEDFHAAFGLGRDERHISPGDTAGVALAAIQALAERLDRREREIAGLRARLEALEASR